MVFTFLQIFCQTGVKQLFLLILFFRSLWIWWRMKTEKSTRSFTMTLRKLQLFKEWIGKFKIKPSSFRLILKSQNWFSVKYARKRARKIEDFSRSKNFPNCQKFQKLTSLRRDQMLFTLFFCQSGFSYVYIPKNTLHHIIIRKIFFDSKQKNIRQTHLIESKHIKKPLVMFFFFLPIPDSLHR